eukprot:gene23314-31780_t
MSASPVPASSPPQVTRHYIAYHGGTGDKINGTQYSTQYNATNRTLSDSYWKTYGAFQDPTLGAAGQ